jgi:PAS domain S-box-containing protein
VRVSAAPSSAESDRSQTLRSYSILGTPSEEVFDDLVRVAARACDVPAALLVFLDGERFWCKAAHGADAGALQLPASLHALLREARGPLTVSGIGGAALGSCAAAPLANAEGVVLGALLVLDRESRRFQEGELKDLGALARMGMDRLEARRTLDVLGKGKQAMERLMAERAEQSGWGRAELLESVIDQIAEAVLVVDAAGGRLVRNAAALRLTGVSAADAGPREWAVRFGFFLEDRKTPVPPEANPLAAVMRGEEPRNVELWLKNAAHPEGRWVSVNAAALRTATGELRGGIFTIRDVTERREAERMLREEEARFRALSESAFEGIVLSAGGRIVEVNPAFARMVGYPPAELQGKELADLVHPDYVDLVRSRVLAGAEEPYEILLRGKDGASRVVDVRGRTLEFRGRAVRVSAIQDIGRRKAAEDAVGAALQRALAQEASLLALTRSPGVNGADLDAALREIVRVSALTLGVERASIWTFTDDRSRLVCRRLFEPSGRTTDEGLEILQERFPAYFRALGDSDVVAADEAELDPRTSAFAKDYLRPRGISSLLDAPIVEGGVLRGVVCHEHVGPPRRWTQDEKLFAVGVASVAARTIAEARRREAESASRASEERFSDLFESASDLIQSVREDGTFEYVNRAWRETLGYSAAEVAAMNCWQVVAPESRSHCEEVFAVLRSGEAVGWIDAVFLAKDGRRVYLEGTSNVRSVDGRPAAIRGIFRDVSDRRRAEAALRNSEERISDLLEKASDIVAVLRPEGRIDYVNRAWRERLGYTLEEAQKLSWEYIVDPDQLPGLRALWERALRGEDVGLIELTAIGKQGRRVHAVGRISAEILDGAPVSVRTVFKDVTQERETEEALRRSEAALVRLGEQSGMRTSLERLIGKSEAMQEVYRRLRLAAQSDVTVLLTGESGTGKELAARALHSLGRRRDKPILAVNCSAIPEALLESELFGHAKGAFTGAIRDKVGLFQAAEGGTLFLDEIGDMPASLQVKVLRALQEREVRRVGDERAATVDVRLIAATNRNLPARVADQKMREDFYYRIRVFEIRLPALRSRREDIPLLLDYFLKEFSAEFEKPVKRVDPDAVRLLMNHDWPGNVRELRNAVEHAFVTLQGDRLGLANLPPELRCEKPPVARDGTAREAVPEGFSEEERRERERIVEELRKTDGSRSRAARNLGISRGTLWNRMTKYGIRG